MTYVIDFDGTITANISFYQQLCYLVKKSGHQLIILSGCNPKRIGSVINDLSRMGICYDLLIPRPESIESGPYNIGKWKKQVLSGIPSGVWFDNEIKNYQDAGVDFSDLNIEIMRA